MHSGLIDPGDVVSRWGEDDDPKVVWATTGSYLYLTEGDKFDLKHPRLRSEWRKIGSLDPREYLILKTIIHLCQTWGDELILIPNGDHRLYDPNVCGLDLCGYIHEGVDWQDTRYPLETLVDLTVVTGDPDEQ